MLGWLVEETAAWGVTLERAPRDVWMLYVKNLFELTMLRQ